MAASSDSNPNFPPNLQIHPSTPNSLRYLAKDDSNQANFGFRAQEIAIREYGIAGRVWEAAYAMTLYVHPPPNLFFDPPFIDASRYAEKASIIELGSGTGLVASSIADLLKPGRDHLIVTDLPKVCPLLEKNLRSIQLVLETGSPNQNTLVIRPLSWGSRDDAEALASEFFNQPDTSTEYGPLTCVVCSDLVYFPELLAPLLRSLLHLSSPPFVQVPETDTGRFEPSILISYKVRSLAKETSFWSAFGLWFEFSPVLVKDSLSEGGWQCFGAGLDDTTFLFIAHRRRESYRWTIPPDDAELLEGVGANGTGRRKGDDTLENLLLMALEQD